MAEPNVTRLNVGRGCTLYVGLYDLMEGAGISLSQEAKDREFCRRSGQLCGGLEVPRSLATFDDEAEGYC